MCILLCYTYATCPHVAKSGIYTCYAAKTSGRGFDEKCKSFKITSQKLRWEKEPKRCASCLEAFGEDKPIRWMRLRKLRKEAQEKAKEAKVDSGSGDGDDAGQVKEVVKQVVKVENFVKGAKDVNGEKIVKGEQADGEGIKGENSV